MGKEGCVSWAEGLHPEDGSITYDNYSTIGRLVIRHILYIFEENVAIIFKG